MIELLNADTLSAGVEHGKNMLDLFNLTTEQMTLIILVIVNIIALVGGWAKLQIKLNEFKNNLDKVEKITEIRNNENQKTIEEVKQNQIDTDKDFLNKFTLLSDKLGDFMLYCEKNFRPRPWWKKNK